MTETRASVDCSKETGCVARCSECDFWFAMRWTRREAWQAVREHEKRAHPGAKQASKVLAYMRD